MYFVQVTEQVSAVQGTTEKDLTDPYGHFISKKKCQILSTPIVFAPDEVFDTYVDIKDDLYLDVQFFKVLIQKANTYMHIFFQLGIFSPGRLLN